MKGSLHVAHRRLSLFVTNDLEPYFNNRVRPFVNGFIKPVLNTIAEHIYQDFQNILHWTGSTDSLHSILVTLESSFGVAVTSWTHTQISSLSRFWTYILLLSVLSFLILALRLLFAQIWRRVYAIVIAFKGVIARLWGWIWWIAVVGVVIGVSWRIVVVKGEEHFGDIDDL